MSMGLDFPIEGGTVTGPGQQLFTILGHFAQNVIRVLDKTWLQTHSPRQEEGDKIMGPFAYRLIMYSKCATHL